MLKHLPNALTLLRLVLAPVIAWATKLAFTPVDIVIGAEGRPPDPSPPWATIAATLFIIAALTDLADGMAARAFNAHSKFGRVLDPIADKAVVGLPLLALSAAFMGNLIWWPAIVGATGVIVARDVFVTIRRLTAADGEGAPVSPLAKWKTAAELVAVAIPLIYGAGMETRLVSQATLLHAQPWIIAWATFLMATAALSVFTGWRYLFAKPSP